MARRRAQEASKVCAARRQCVVSGCKFFNTLLNNPSEREKIERSDLIMCAGKKPLDPPPLSLSRQPILY